MTSGKFTSLDISTIIVDRDERQRRDLKGIPELAASIAEVGLINPILITKDGVLVAGERRLTACETLGWTTVTVQFVEDLDPATLYLIELEENIKRADLDWKDEVLAIKRYHEMRKGEEKDWDSVKTGAALGVNESTIRRKLLVADALIEGEPLIVNADKYSVALNIARRKKEREDAEIEESIDRKVAALARPIGLTKTHVVPDGSPETPGDAPPPPAPVEHDVLHCADFTTWAASYTGKPFNLIHCDFPYGVNADKHAQGASDKFGGYEDSAKVYFSLLETLTQNFDRLVAPSAHILFWFSMDYYQETLTILSKCDNLVVNHFPLVWFKVDNSGILPDPNRGPRRNYETAFLCSRGDRKIIQAVSNVSAVPNKKEIHMSEKPVPMLQHFFRMLVDNTTRLFDPTAGSGNALKAAHLMGAASVFGLEKDPNYCELARKNLEL